MAVLLFPLDRGDPVEAGAKPGGVVPVGPPEDDPAGLGPGGGRSPLHAFSFQRCPGRFGSSVVGTYAGAPGRGPQLMGAAEVEVVIAGALTCPVGVR
ncbi:MAG: hypothetical protein ACP5VR_07230, partial [Acidimicrobiales bacterium]